MQTILRIATGTCVALALTFCSIPRAAAVEPPATEQLPVPRVLDIPEQPLDKSLNQLAQQTGLQIVYLSGVTKGLMAPRLAGRFSPRAALDVLLAGTELKYRFLNQQMIAVQAQPAEVPDGHTSYFLPDQTSKRALRVAKVETAGPRDQSDESISHEKDPQASLESTQLVVTGSHIRGETVPIGSSITIYDESALAESGHATIQDFLRTVPQNFGAHRTDMAGSVGNFTRGTAVDLRGLGAGATLVLVNGRRPAASGDNGNFFDISSIPAAAVERIEVLADGASAIYGSDAVGGVVNIILRRNYSGADSSLRFATAGGDSDESVFAQTFGRSWENTSVLGGYQYYKRTPLARADRAYAASADKRPLGGSDYRDIYSNPGNILNAFGQVAFAIPEGQDGTSLLPGQLLSGMENLAEPADGNQLLPGNESHSVYVAATWVPNEAWELSFDGRYNDRSFNARTAPLVGFLTVPATNPYYVDAFGNGLPVNIAYSFASDFGASATVAGTQAWSASAGARLSLQRGWNVNTNLSFAREQFHFEAPNLNFTELAQALADPNPLTAFNPFGDGSYTAANTLANLQAVTVNAGRTATWSASVIGDGALFELPAGTARLAAGVDRREEMLNSSRSAQDMKRAVSAAFAEFSVPLLRGGNADSDRAALVASIAGRYEHYSDFGGTFNPRFGLRYAPTATLSLRASWGTSFRAPLLIDLDENVTGGQPSIRIRSLQSPAGRQTVVFQTGNNAGLTEETAESWTVGFDLKPRPAMSGLTLSMTYYDIDYENRIIRPGPTPTSNILFEEDIWGALVRRNASPEELADLCSQAVAGNCATTPPVAIVDVRLRNISAWRTRGLDVNLSHSMSTSAGQLSWGVNANYVLAFEQLLTPTAPVIELVDTVDNPPQLRLRANGAWRRGSYGLNWAINHVDGYRDSRAGQERAVGSFTTLDMGLSWRAPQRSGILAGAEVALRALNVLDQDPPFVDNAYGFDSHNASPLGRSISIDLGKAW